jgi:hypothetical protein
MSQLVTFSDVVDAADRLDDESQEELIEVLQRRLAERRRAEFVEGVAEARRELAAGLGVELTIEEFLGELDK